MRNIISLSIKEGQPNGHGHLDAGGSGAARGRVIEQGEEDAAGRAGVMNVAGNRKRCCPSVLYCRLSAERGTITGLITDRD